MGNEEQENNAATLLIGSLFQPVDSLSDEDAEKLFNSPISLSDEDAEKLISTKDLIQNIKLGLNPIKSDYSQEELLVGGMNRSYLNSPSKDIDEEIEKQRKKALEDLENDDELE